MVNVKKRVRLGMDASVAKREWRTNSNHTSPNNNNGNNMKQQQLNYHQQFRPVPNRLAEAFNSSCVKQRAPDRATNWHGSMSDCQMPSSTCAEIRGATEAYSHSRCSASVSNALHKKRITWVVFVHCKKYS